jgi:hypothetical protein
VAVVVEEAAGRVVVAAGWLVAAAGWLMAAAGRLVAAAGWLVAAAGRLVAAAGQADDLGMMGTETGVEVYNTHPAWTAAGETVEAAAAETAGVG